MNKVVYGRGEYGGLYSLFCFKLKSRDLKWGVNSGIIKQMRELLQIREESINND